MPLTKPTPPTPPTIDKGEATESTPRIDAHQFFNIPFKRETEKPAPIETPVETPVETPPAAVERKTTTPEDMAREAVANGGGALTKKTVTRPDNETTAPTLTNTPAISTVPLTTEKSKRGKEILREFQNEDRQNFQTVETPRNVNLNRNESYSGSYWIVMLILVGVLSVVFVRKVLVKKNPTLKKSDLFEDADKRLQVVSEKVATPKISTAKLNTVEKISEPTQNLPPKKDDSKGKHFEVRV